MSPLAIAVFLEPSLLQALGCLPCQLFVSQPQTYDVASLSVAISEMVSRVLDGQIVDKLNITALQSHSKLVLDSQKVDHI